MVRPGILPTSEVIKKGRGATDRHVFLFDHLLVLTKVHRSSRSEKPIYKFKGKVLIRKSDIFDLSDTEELQNAFKIESRSAGRDGTVTSSWILFCKSAEEKTSWMSDLVMIQTKSLLDRMLDSSLKEEEKRIPLIIPGPDQYRFADVDCDENIVFEDYTSSSGIPVVKHGTVLKLVERLTYHLYTDNNYVRTFLTTYRSFCSPQELLQLLIERFNVPTPFQLRAIEQSIAPPQSRCLLNGPYATVHSQGLCGQLPPSVWSRVEQGYQRFRKEYQRPIQCRVLSVMRQWVNGHWYDFEGDDKLLNNLCAFLEETDRQANVTNQHKKWCKSIQTCIERKRRSDSTTAHTPTVELDDDIPPPLNSPNSFAPVKPPIVWHSAKKGEIDSYDLLTLHPLEIGRQVTLLEFELYRAIKPIELVGSAWTKQDKDRRSPQLLKLIDHSTMLTYWVARSIVETPSLEERVGMFSRVLEVMSVFEELNNFTGLVAFYSALNSSSVYRLRACWERIDREKQICYEKFKKLCNPHWKEMIDRLQSINPPCVPFFGHYLSKIFFYEEGNSTFVQNNNEELSHEQMSGDGNSGVNSNASNRKILVSFVKCRRIAAIISDIQMYQNQPYALQVEPSIRQFFEAINPLNGFDGKESLETYMWEQSLKVEPKDAEKLDTIKPSRPPNVLKSPGIKPPKTLSSVGSSSGPSNHYAGYRSSGRGFSASFNTYSPGMFSEPPETPRSFAENASQMEERNSHLGMVEINPGYQPRYLGDARRGEASPLNSVLCSTVPPPLVPRLRKEKARSGPPSPLNNIVPLSISKNDDATNSPPPPLYPRRTSPHFFPSPVLPPPPFRAPSITSCTAPTSPLSPSLSSAPTERAESFIFPPNCSMDENRTFLAESGTIQASCSSAPAVPPRRKGEALPAPLPPDAVRVVWSGDASPRVPLVTAVLPLPSLPNSAAPPLYPRRSVDVQPPPRPPKDSYQRRLAASSTNVAHTESSDSESPPPPLPPKTYKRQQRRS
uniref:Son of sevenless 2 n=1 Tax=Ascaris suum TaxID=6253 RepID=F1KUD9_ASCSU